MLMESKLTVYKIYIYWLLLWEQVLSCGFGFFSEVAFIFHRISKHNPEWLFHPPEIGRLCGLGIVMFLVSPSNLCVLNCLHFMVVHLLANNVWRWTLFFIWVKKNATKPSGKKCIQTNSHFRNCHINESQVREQGGAAHFSKDLLPSI